MAAQETADHIIRTRAVTADAILANRADLRPYPYRLISIVSHRGIGGDQVTQALAAAELLETFGWQLVSVSEFASSRIVHAIMRRR